MRTANRIKITSIFLFLLGFQSVIAQDIKQNVNSNLKQFTIENCVNEFSIDKATETKSGYVYWFADKDFIDGRTLKMSVVKPNQATHPPHIHTEDEFFFILEGKAKFYLDGKTRIVGPNTSLYCPANVEHGISNAGDTEVKYLVIKKYPK